MPIIHLEPFVGRHCESTTLVNLLKHEGLELSEPLVFGLGEGLAYIYWKSRGMDYPFVGGRIKPGGLVENAVDRLDLKANMKESQSEGKAWRNVAQEIEAGRPVGLKLDSYYLDYYDHTLHFAAHYVTCYGYDEDKAYLIDTATAHGPSSTSLDSLVKARSWRGPMASRSLSFTLEVESDQPPALRELIPRAIERNAHTFLHAPINNVGCKGMKKTSDVMVDWLETVTDPGANLPVMAMLMERAGTGGGLFRKVYADFLLEASEHTGDSRYQASARTYGDLAIRWTEVSRLVDQAGRSMERAPLENASAMLAKLSEDEEKAMTTLYLLVTQ